MGKHSVVTRNDFQFEFNFLRFFHQEKKGEDALTPGFKKYEKVLVWEISEGKIRSLGR